jgi:FixJ family two-component response regulator
LGIFHAANSVTLLIAVFSMSITRIILVDDDPLITDALPLLLKIHLPVQILTCNTARAALREIAVTPPHLLITDVKMPEISGLELAQRAREIHAKLPIIVLTGYGDDPDITRQITNLGNVRLLHKPWKTVELLSAIRDLVHLSLVDPSLDSAPDRVS